MGLMPTFPHGEWVRKEMFFNVFGPIPQKEFLTSFSNCVVEKLGRVFVDLTVVLFELICSRHLGKLPPQTHLRAGPGCELQTHRRSNEIPASDDPLPPSRLEMAPRGRPKGKRKWSSRVIARDTIRGRLALWEASTLCFKAE